MMRIVQKEQGLRVRGWGVGDSQEEGGWELVEDTPLRHTKAVTGGEQMQSMWPGRV